MALQIITDTSCDLTWARLDELKVRCLPLGLTIAGRSYPDEEGYLPDVDEFYEMQAESGGATGTSGLTVPAIKEAFEQVLQAGDDVLYLGIVPDLSAATWNSMHIALAELREEYPERRIETPNTHSIAPGLGLLLERMVELRDTGAKMDLMLKELSYWVERTAHWFTVDNFNQLKKSGRVSNIEAAVAGLLHIKPVMRLPLNGKLESVGKVRGEKAIIRELSDIVYDTLYEDGGKVWVSYGASSQRERAEQLAEAIREKRPGAQVSASQRIGPIIGAHTGPTVLAVFFFSKKR
ncbi:DegV family protein [Candidatus Saccharibacteria bacterium]|nr:DegV family protein [Candidatus Saccharibacteria bacterium]